MALTLAQIQANITNNGDARQILNQIADYLEANPGGGGGSGMVLEEYENSAMSAPVMAYVFRDEDDNIFMVYEPIRNNIVSRKTYAYADSIDQFAFDSADNFNNRILDVKLVTVPAATKFQNCDLRTMIINATDKTGVEFISHNQTGNFGVGIVALSGHGEEIYITGNGVKFDGNTVLGGSSNNCATFFDALGLDSLINGNTFSNCCTIFGNGFKTIITDCPIGMFTYITVDEDMLNPLLDIETGENAYIEVNSGSSVVGNCKMGTNAELYINAGGITILRAKLDVGASVNAGHDITRSTFGNDTAVTTAGAIAAGSNFINVGGTTYLIGEAAGAATLTPV